MCKSSKSGLGLCQLRWPAGVEVELRLLDNFKYLSSKENVFHPVDLWGGNIWDYIRFHLQDVRLHLNG
jgi:hypothetical protein